MSATATKGEFGTMYEVGDGLFAFIQPHGTWCISNTGLIVGPDSATAIDSCATERRTRDLLDCIGRVTDKPIDLLVNTHYHIDHVNGNGLMGASTIVAQDRCREHMMVHSGPPDGVFEEVEWGAIDPVPANLTFTARLDLWMGDRKVELHHAGRRAHTDDDVTVWVPDERVLFVGDIVMHGSMPLAMDGSVRGILATLRELRELEPAVVVPGHGEVGGIELIDEQIRFYDLIWRAAEEARASGTSMLEAARAIDLGDFPPFLDGERLVANLHRAAAEQEDPEVGDLDMAMVGADMLALNGGPVRSLA